jgi:MFS family permease
MFLVPWLLYLMAVLLMLRFLPDAPAPTSGTRALATVLSAFSIAPFRNRDFSLAFACRFLLTTGNSFAQTYQVFVLMDVIGLASGQVPSAMFTTTACVAVMGAILSPLAGTLVDKTGRMKPLVVVAGALVIAGLAVSQTKTLKPFITAMVVLGVGKSVVYALTTALAASVLPDKGNAAKDMGIIQIANSLPQSLAPALGPLLMMIGGGHANYEAMFIAAAFLPQAACSPSCPFGISNRKDPCPWRPHPTLTPLSSMKPAWCSTGSHPMMPGGSVVSCVRPGIRLRPPSPSKSP